MTKENWKDFEPLPGSFHSESNEDFYKIPLRTRLKIALKERMPCQQPKPTYSKNLIEQYNLFKEQIYIPKRVFYPCCNLDASPLRGFPDSEIILLDRGDAQKNLDEIMQKHKVRQFRLGDVLNYYPENPFDLVIALNPCLPSKDLTKYLSNGGFVLANNWHKNAEQLDEDKEFENIGVIDRENKNFYIGKYVNPRESSIYGDFYIFRKH